MSLFVTKEKSVLYIYIYRIEAADCGFTFKICVILESFKFYLNIHLKFRLIKKAFSPISQTLDTDINFVHLI